MEGDMYSAPSSGPFVVLRAMGAVLHITSAELDEGIPMVGQTHFAADCRASHREHGPVGSLLLCCSESPYLQDWAWGL